MALGDFLGQLFGFSAQPKAELTDYAKRRIAEGALDGINFKTQIVPPAKTASVQQIKPSAISRQTQINEVDNAMRGRVQGMSTQKPGIFKRPQLPSKSAISNKLNQALVPFANVGEQIYNTPGLGFGNPFGIGPSLKDIIGIEPGLGDRIFGVTDAVNSTNAASRERMRLEGMGNDRVNAFLALYPEMRGDIRTLGQLANLVRSNPGQYTVPKRADNQYIYF